MIREYPHRIQKLPIRLVKKAYSGLSTIRTITLVKSTFVCMKCFTQFTGKVIPYNVHNYIDMCTKTLSTRFDAHLLFHKYTAVET